MALLAGGEGQRSSRIDWIWASIAASERAKLNCNNIIMIINKIGKWLCDRMIMQISHLARLVLANWCSSYIEPVVRLASWKRCSSMPSSSPSMSNIPSHSRWWRHWLCLSLFLTEGTSIMNKLRTNHPTYTIAWLDQSIIRVGICCCCWLVSPKATPSIQWCPSFYELHQALHSGNSSE